MIRDNKIKGAIQVCYELTAENRDREINGLVEACEKFKLKEGLILTLDDEDELEATGSGRLAAGKKIRIMPVWKWMLEN